MEMEWNMVARVQQGHIDATASGQLMRSSPDGKRALRTIRPLPSRCRVRACSGDGAARRTRGAMHHPEESAQSGFALLTLRMEPWIW
jgi:hypothetical protein